VYVKDTKRMSESAIFFDEDRILDVI